MSKKKKMPLGGLTVALLSASVVLLAGSTIGSARAALTYYSENYGAQVEVSNIGVSLVENDKVVSKRDDRRSADRSERRKNRTGKTVRGSNQGNKQRLH